MDETTPVAGEELARRLIEIITTKLTLETGQKLQAVRYNTTNEHQRCFANALVKLDPDIGSHIYTFISKLGDLRFGAKYVREIKVYLYMLLTSATSWCPGLRECLTTENVPALISDDMVGTQQDYREDELLTELIDYSFSVIGNCSNSEELCPILSQQVMPKLLTYVDPETNTPHIVINAMILIDRLDSTSRLSEYLYDQDCFDALSEILSSMYFDETLHRYMCRTADCVVTTSYTEPANINRCLCILAQAPHYKCKVLNVLLENHEHFHLLMLSERQVFRDAANEVLALVIDHKCEQCEGAAYFRNRYRELLEGNITALSPQPSTREPGTSTSHVSSPVRSSDESASSLSKETESPQKVCPYFTLSQMYFQALNISVEYLQTDHDVCFCTPCMGARGDSTTYPRGQPPKPYAVPVGWAKFAIRGPPRAKALDIWSNWHVGYHGTRPNTVKDILETGDLLKPGDIAPTGNVLSPVPGHFTEEDRSASFISQFFMSPSIVYSSLDAYAPRSQSFEDPVSKQTYVARVALQARIKPGSYKIGPETVGATTRRVPIDPIFPNSELEWFTPNRGVIIPTGILIKLERTDGLPVSPAPIANPPPPTARAADAPRKKKKVPTATLR